MEGEFSVAQFFCDDSFEYVGRWLDAESAVQLAKRMTDSLGGRLGTTKRVIITDAMDLTCFEWVFGKGVTFPPLHRNDQQRGK